MTSLLLRHLPEIYLLYGFSFLILATAVALQPRGFETKLERHLWLLGLFGLLHGFTELSDWLALSYPPLVFQCRVAGLALLAASYFALLEFARRMLKENALKIAGVHGGIVWGVPLILLAAASAAAPDRLAGFNVAARLFVGLPASLLTSLAFFLKAREVRRWTPNDATQCPVTLSVGFIFLLYGFFTVVTRSENPSWWSWLPSEDRFIAWTGIPVQVARTFCALAAATSVSFMLRRLNSRVRNHEQSLTRELNALNATLEDRIRNRTLDLQAANLELERQFETQKKIVNELMRRESQLRTVFDQMAVGVTFLDAEGRYFRVNERFAAILGRKREEIVGKHFSAFTHPQDTGADFENWKSMRAAQSRFSAREKRYVRPDGTPVWCSVTVSAVQDDAGKFLHYLGVVIDINERQLAAAAQRDSENKLRLALSAARQGMFEFDLRSRTVTATGTPGDNDSSDDFRGTFEEWLSRVHPEDKPRAQALARHLNSGTQSGHHIALEFRRKHPDGSWRWVLATGSRIDDPETGAARIVGTHIDITEQRDLERRVLRSQRLESIGQLASGIAHDLNNSLVPIISGLSVVRQRIHPEDAELFSAMELSARRTADMGRQLLSFAKGADGRKLLLTPKDLVNEMANFVISTFPKNIQLSCSCPYLDGKTAGNSKVPKLDGCEGCESCREQRTKILGDPTQLHQVLLNLCINARDAMPHGGELSIRLDFTEVDSGLASENGGVTPGRFVRFTVSDTGCGIPASALDRIFDPFFTTKGPDKGSGLGLATVLGIVRGHGGFITVDTEEDQGTQFEVYLPIAPGDASAQPPATA